MKIKIIFTVVILVTFKDFILVTARSVQNATEEISSVGTVNNCSQVDLVNDCQTIEEGESVKYRKSRICEVDISGVSGRRRKGGGGSNTNVMKTNVCKVNINR